MTKMPTLSVVVPMLNEKDYIRNCLDALLNQKHPIDEIIIVNNGSTDGCDRIVADEYPEVTLLDEKKQGIVYARNTGFDHAKTDVIAKIDVDTVVRSDWAQCMLQDFADKGCDGWSGWGTSYEINKFIEPVTVFLYNHTVFTLSRFVAGHTFMTGNNMAITLDIWKQIRPNLLMRNDIWEDLDMTILAVRAGAKIHINKRRIVGVSLRSANVSTATMFRRSYGMSRVYKLRGRWVSYVLSLPFITQSIAIWFVLRPLSFIGQKVGKRPRPEQY